MGPSFPEYSHTQNRVFWNGSTMEVVWEWESHYCPKKTKSHCPSLYRRSSCFGLLRHRRRSQWSKSRRRYRPSTWPWRSFINDPTATPAPGTCTTALESLRNGNLMGLNGGLVGLKPVRNMLKPGCFSFKVGQDAIDSGYIYVYIYMYGAYLYIFFFIIYIYVD